MNNKIKLITKELAEKGDLQALRLQTAQIISERKESFYIGEKKLKINNQSPPQTNPIYIYDIGFKKTNKKIIPINNHVNKTGVSVMREHPKSKKNPNTQIQFYDITNIYQNQKNGQIAECFGSQIPPEQTKGYVQTHFLCNYVIKLYCLGYTKIFAHVID